MRIMVVVALLMLTGCSALPWDAEGTTERVRGTKVLRSGVIAAGNGAPDASLHKFLNLVAHDTGSRPEIREGSMETLLPMVEKGDLDIVVGHVAPETPWATRVTILPQPQKMKAGANEPVRAAIIRNGENAWVALVHRHAPSLREQAR